MFEMSITKQLRKAPALLDTFEYPDQFSYIAERIGDEEACSLLWYLPSFEIRRIPLKPSNLMKLKVIKEEFDGTNSLSLAVKLNIRHEKIKKLVKQVQTMDIQIDTECNEEMALITELCGSSVAYKLLQHFPGHSIQIPKTGHYAMLRKLVKQEFNGTNHKKLAVKYKVGVSFIYKILKEDMKPKSLHKQFDLFQGV